VSEVAYEDLETLSTFLRDNYNYNTGAFEGYSRAQNSDKATVRLDWNASQNHRVSVKYNYLKSYRDVNQVPVVRCRAAVTRPDPPALLRRLLPDQQQPES
jgi:hypothetical protein